MPGWLLYFGCFVWCYINCGYFATAFVLLTFENFHTVYSSMFYALHITLALMILLSHALMPPTKKEGATQEEKETSKLKSN